MAYAITLEIRGRSVTLPRERIHVWGGSEFDPEGLQYGELHERYWARAGSIRERLISGISWNGEDGFPLPTIAFEFGSEYPDPE